VAHHHGAALVGGTPWPHPYVRSYPKGEGANRHRVYVYHVTRSANIEDYIKFLEANNLVRREDNKPDGELCYFSKKILRAGTTVIQSFTKEGKEQWWDQDLETEAMIALANQHAGTAFGDALMKSVADKMVQDFKMRSVVTTIAPEVIVPEKAIPDLD
jgi:hypothetical protein